MNEADYHALSEHLEGIRPIFDTFCTKHGFFHANKLSLGRYPRIRIEKPAFVKLWFDLSMELNQEGRRFEKFTPDLPYGLGAGAYIEFQDGPEYGARLQTAFTCFSDKPFYEVGAILEAKMESSLRVLEGWDVRYLQAHGKKIQLRL